MITIVLLHALPLDSAMWAGPRAVLERRGHWVLAPDQRGFGVAPLGSAPPSLDVVADDLAALLDDRGIRRVALVGCSMGGYVAMAFQRRHPDRLAALALLGTRAGQDAPDVRKGREEFAERILADEARAGLVAATTPALLGATTRAQRPHLLAEVRAAVERAAPESVAWAQRAIAARPDSTDPLRAPTGPSVVVAGAQDELVRAEESAALAAVLPRGRLVTLPGAGHLTPVEAPDLVAAEIDELVRGAHVD